MTFVRNVAGYEARAALYQNNCDMRSNVAIKAFLAHRWQAPIAIGLFGLLTAQAVRADAPPCTIPAGEKVRFHLLAPVSSNQSKTGETFDFVLLDSIQSDGCMVPAAGAKGSGTVYLAGASGSSGHEGDLTLRLDSIRTADGRLVTFADQRIEINGRNRKITSAVLGFVPFVGIGARFIRGSDIRVDATTAVETVLLRPATVVDASSVPSPLPTTSASPSPSPLPSASP